MTAFRVNRVHVETSTSGTVDFVVGAAISTAYQSFAGASVPDGATFSYVAYTATQFECARGAYILGTTTVDRTAANVIAGSAGAGALTNFSTSPRLFIGPLAEDSRELLTATTDYYVATTGSDTTGDGSAGNPWATPQGAWDHLKTQVDAGGHSITINLANGTYTGLYLDEGVTAANVFFKGNVSDPTLVVIDDEPAVLTLGNVVPTVWFGDLTLAGAQLMQLEGRAFVRFGFGDIVLAPKTSSVSNVRVWDDCYLLDRSSSLKIDYTVYVGAGVQRGFLDVDIRGIVVLGNTVNNSLEGTVSWDDAFVKTEVGGRYYNNRPWVGTHTVTGKRFICGALSFIAVYAQGFEVLPGDTAGTITGGGRYMN